MSNRFKRGSGAYTCRCCKKLTRDTGEGEASCDLCKSCYFSSTDENECSDTHEEGSGQCILCTPDAKPTFLKCGCLDAVQEGGAA